jgi:hypothetical protein
VSTNTVNETGRQHLQRPTRQDAEHRVLDQVRRLADGHREGLGITASVWVVDTRSVEATAITADTAL